MRQKSTQQLPLEEKTLFSDPFSKPNLFLSQQIKTLCHNSKRGTEELKQALMESIAPKFQHQFPRYKLQESHLSARLQKFQKISKQIEGEKEALTQEGKLNIPFFIRHHLENRTQTPFSCGMHPFAFAHQLAMKMGECIAIYDGIRPKLDELTKTIWAVERHLITELPSSPHPTPNEKIDKLIALAMLEIGSKTPNLSQPELSFHVEKWLKELDKTTHILNTRQRKKALAALLADQLNRSSHRMERLLDTIPYSVAKCLKKQLAAIAIDHPHLSPENVVDKAADFFAKAEGVSRNYSDQALRHKIYNWTIQGDMALRWIRLNTASALYQEIVQGWENNSSSSLAWKTCQSYLEKWPWLTPFAKEVEIRTWMYLKSAWYTQQLPPSSSTYDHFIRWHKWELEAQSLSLHQLMQTVEMLSKRMLPLVPFNRGRVQTLLVTEKEEHNSE